MVIEAITTAVTFSAFITKKPIVKKKNQSLNFDPNNKLIKKAGVIITLRQIDVALKCDGVDLVAE